MKKPKIFIACDTTNIKKILSLEDDKKRGDIYFREGDLRDKKWLDNIFNEFKNNSLEIYAVIHFAGLKAVEESVKDPLKYWDFNVVGTVNLLRVMIEFNCKTIIFIEKSDAYRLKLKEIKLLRVKKTSKTPYFDGFFLILINS